MEELRFHPAAALEAIEAIEASAYLEESRLRYSEKFEAELDRLCARIIDHPRSGTRLPDYPGELEVRSYRMQIFRYSFFVATVNGAPVVLAVAHHRKRGNWRDRVE